MSGTLMRISGFMVGLGRDAKTLTLMTEGGRAELRVWLFLRVVPPLLERLVEYTFEGKFTDDSTGFFANELVGARARPFCDQLALSLFKSTQPQTKVGGGLEVFLERLGGQAVPPSLTYWMDFDAYARLWQLAPDAGAWPVEGREVVALVMEGKWREIGTEHMRLSGTRVGLLDRQMGEDLRWYNELIDLACERGATMSFAEVEAGVLNAPGVSLTTLSDLVTVEDGVLEIDWMRERELSVLSDFFPNGVEVPPSSEDVGVERVLEIALSSRFTFVDVQDERQLVTLLEEKGVFVVNDCHRSLASASTLNGHEHVVFMADLELSQDRALQTRKMTLASCRALPWHRLARPSFHATDDDGGNVVRRVFPGGRAVKIVEDTWEKRMERLRTLVCGRKAGKIAVLYVFPRGAEFEMAKYLHGGVGESHVVMEVVASDDMAVPPGTFFRRRDGGGKPGVDQVGVQCKAWHACVTHDLVRLPTDSHDVVVLFSIKRVLRHRWIAEARRVGRSGLLVLMC